MAATATAATAMTRKNQIEAAAQTSEAAEETVATARAVVAAATATSRWRQLQRLLQEQQRWGYTTIKNVSGNGKTTAAVAAALGGCEWWQGAAFGNKGGGVAAFNATWLRRIGGQAHRREEGGGDFGVAGSTQTISCFKAAPRQKSRNRYPGGYHNPYF